MLHTLAATWHQCLWSLSVVLLCSQFVGKQFAVINGCAAVLTGFEVDGAVLKVDDLQQQARLGVDAARDPRYVTGLGVCVYSSSIEHGLGQLGV